MKKSLAIILVLVIALSSVFAACGNKTRNNEGDVEIAADNGENEGGLESADTEIEFVEVPVTDEDGKEVTDENGETKTEEVAVVVNTDKKGNRTGVVIDANGDPVTNAKGKEVTVKLEKETTTKKGKTKTTTTKKSKTTKTTATTTIKPDKGDGTTTPDEPTTKEYVGVPKTSASGTSVTFSSEDQQVIKNMLEVPYLYKSSYENSDGVPINIASHAAIWMLKNEGLSTSTYASGTVVIDLFKYFGQTVVNFKAKCNEQGDNENITYNANNDSFVISAFEDKKQEVTLTNIEDLGNNYYKVEASVSNADGKSKVTAIFQKNRLDLSLGFSLKAAKWS